VFNLTIEKPSLLNNEVQGFYFKTNIRTPGKEQGTV
jgi:hypothetical protein